MGVKPLSRKCASICTDKRDPELWTFEILKHYFTGNVSLWQCPCTTDAAVTMVSESHGLINNWKVAAAMLASCWINHWQPQSPEISVQDPHITGSYQCYWIKDYFAIVAVPEKEFDCLLLRVERRWYSEENCFKTFYLFFDTNMQSLFQSVKN